MLAKRFLSVAGSRTISETAASLFAKGCAALAEHPLHARCELSSGALLSGDVDDALWRDRHHILFDLNSFPGEAWRPVQTGRFEGCGADGVASPFPLFHLLSEVSHLHGASDKVPSGMFADSTKRKRKKKMNKHKHRKRIKKLRHQKKK